MGISAAPDQRIEGSLPSRQVHMRDQRRSNGGLGHLCAARYDRQ